MLYFPFDWITYKSFVFFFAKDQKLTTVFPFFLSPFSLLPSRLPPLSPSLLHPHTKQPLLQRRFVSAQGTSPVPKKSNLGPLKSSHLNFLRWNRSSEFKPQMTNDKQLLTKMSHIKLFLNIVNTFWKKQWQFITKKLPPRACVYELFLKQLLKILYKTYCVPNMKALALSVLKMFTLRLLQIMCYKENTILILILILISK